MGVLSIIDGCIDNRVNERDWQRGVVGRAYLYTIYIYVMYKCYVIMDVLGGLQPHKPPPRSAPA